jgi:hypothetical protein
MDHRGRHRAAECPEDELRVGLELLGMDIVRHGRDFYSGSRRLSLLLPVALRVR